MADRWWFREPRVRGERSVGRVGYMSTVRWEHCATLETSVLVGFGFVVDGLWMLAEHKNTGGQSVWWPRRSRCT